MQVNRSEGRINESGIIILRKRAALRSIYDTFGGNTMPEMEQLIQIGVIVLIGLFVLAQLFLSLRPGFIWGLFMPVLFGAFWFLLIQRPDLIPFELGLNQMALDLFNRVGLAGIGFSLLLFIICRLGMLLRKKGREKKRQARLHEKRLRQEREARMMSEQK